MLGLNTNTENFWPGCSAPSFRAPAVFLGSTSIVDLRSFRGKNVLLIFYPMDFGYICSTELTALDDKLEEFHGDDCEVLAISTSSLISKIAFLSTDKEQGGVAGSKIRLVEDKEGAIGHMYGVMKEDSGYAYRAIVLIDKNGFIISRTVSDLPIGCGVSGALDIIRKATGRHQETEPKLQRDDDGKKSSIRETKLTLKSDKSEEDDTDGHVTNDMVDKSKEGSNGEVEALVGPGPPMCDCAIEYSHTVNHHIIGNIEKKKKESELQ